MNVRDFTEKKKEKTQEMYEKEQERGGTKEVRINEELKIG